MSLCAPPRAKSLNARSLRSLANVKVRVKVSVGLARIVNWSVCPRAFIVGSLVSSCRLKSQHEMNRRIVASQSNKIVPFFLILFAIQYVIGQSVQRLEWKHTDTTEFITRPTNDVRRSVNMAGCMCVCVCFYSARFVSFV